MDRYALPAAIFALAIAIFVHAIRPAFAEGTSPGMACANPVKDSGASKVPEAMADWGNRNLTEGREHFITFGAYACAW